ncbi:MAG: hypothetical protein IKQ82_06910 [Lentisphaeria bacterium]|nr:hypothetical protein [Lentisphaeria bacterium]
MDTTFLSIALAVLEMTFLFVTLLLLHGLKKQLGAPASYVAMGLLFGFTQFAGAGGLTSRPDTPGSTSRCRPAC